MTMHGLRTSRPASHGPLHSLSTIRDAISTFARKLTRVSLIYRTEPTGDSSLFTIMEYMELTDNLIRTRGNKFKLVQHHCHYDIRKYNFTNRVIPIWNSLSNHVVSAETVNTFKNRLDKFWSDQKVLYDYKTDLHCTGNRSIV